MTELAPDLTNEAEGLIEGAKEAAQAPEPKVGRITLLSGDCVSVGELLPWKGAWWRVIAFPAFKDAEGKTIGYGALLAPGDQTMGGVKRAHKGRRKGVK